MVRRMAAICTALALLTALPAWAQDITVGVKGGLSVTDLSIDDPTETPNPDPDTRSTFVGGAYADFGLGGFFSVQPEVLFSQKGAKQTEQVEGMPISLSFNLSYIEIPLLIKARFAIPESPLRPMLYVAPVVAFETKCEVEGSIDEATVTVDCEALTLDGEDMTLQTRTTDFGVAFGGGLDVMAGPVVITGDLRYTLGLTNINDTHGAEDVTIKNRAWQLFLGVGLPLGR